jgi:hypothetical protein
MNGADPVDLEFGSGEVIAPLTATAILSKYDGDCNLIWYHAIGGGADTFATSDGVFPLLDGRVVWRVEASGGVAVDVDQGPGITLLSGVGLVVIDAVGNFETLYSLNGANFITVTDIVQLPDGEIRMIGRLQESASIDFDLSDTGVHMVSTSGNSRDTYIASYDADFQLNWVHTFPGESNAEVQSSIAPVRPI